MVNTLPPLYNFLWVYRLSLNKLYTRQVFESCFNLTNKALVFLPTLRCKTVQGWWPCENRTALDAKWDKGKPFPNRGCGTSLSSRHCLYFYVMASVQIPMIAKGIRRWYSHGSRLKCNGANPNCRWTCLRLSIKVMFYKLLPFLQWQEIAFHIK